MERTPLEMTPSISDSAENLPHVVFTRNVHLEDSNVKDTARINTGNVTFGRRVVEIKDGNGNVASEIYLG